MGRDEPTDQDLVRAFQGGDTDAFAVFVGRHAGRLHRMARVWLFNPEAAADAVQETFARSYRGLGRFRFRAEPATWIMRVCRNVCHEENRYARRTVATMDMTALVEAQEPGSRGDDGADDRDALAMLRHLAPRQRDVVVLRILEGLSVRDTARVMGCREGTVKAHLNKALARLRLEGNAHDD